LIPCQHFPDLQKLFIPSIDDLPWDKYSPEHIQKLNNLGIERPKDISTSLEPDYNIEQFLDLQNLTSSGKSEPLMHLIKIC